MATELMLIRHGNAVRINGDYVHAPLTALGQEQAGLTGEYFTGSQIQLGGFYSSPLRRTQETAGIIGSKIGQKAELQDGVQELRFHEMPALVLLEFLSITDPVEDYLDARAGKSIRWPIEGRVAEVLLALVAKHSEQRIAVVTHSGVISAALSWYFPEKRWTWWRTIVSNCSLTRFKVDGPHAELLAVNDVKHLTPAAVTTQKATRTVEIARSVHPAAKPSLPGKSADTK